MKSNIVRTRYAPSPTGFFHIGGARTALFNYLFSKANDGIFIVRIEDTDSQRNVEGGIESQLENLKWLKLFFDESPENPGLYGPYIQSEKLDIYFDVAMQLLNSGHAYKCYCTKEELALEKEMAILNKETPKYSRKCFHLSKEEKKSLEDEQKPWTIRLSIDDNQVFEWDDLIRGKISIPSNSMSDIIILKADKKPTYNFASTIDDSEMEISHVLRGEEHISNTPYQIAISNILGINENIKYGHLSLIVDENRKKLSKRDNSVKQFIEEFKNLGFISEAIVNYMSLLGWAPEDGNEIKGINDIISQFELKSVSSSPSMFDIKKLEWVNKEYIKKMSENNYIDFVSKYLDEKYKEIENLNEILILFKSQISYASEINYYIEDFFYKNEFNIEKFIECNFDKQSILSISNFLEKEFILIENWSLEAIELILNSIKESLSLNGKNFFLPIRFILTTKQQGPELLKSIWLLGKKNIMRNILNFKIFLKENISVIKNEI